MTPWARRVARGAEVPEEASDPCLLLCVVTQIKELASSPYRTYRAEEETVRSKLPAVGAQISRCPAQPSAEAVSVPTVPKLLGTFQGFFLEPHLSPFAYTL